MSVLYPKLSKTKIIALFFAIAALAYFLYPRDIFLAKLYEQSESYEKAEKYYKQYLEKHPANKNITLKLYALYQRSGEPEKAKPYLDRLLAIRHKDWDLSQLYLNYLDEQNLKEEAFQARLNIARSFREDKQIPRQKIEALYDEALRYALWKQKTEEAYSILEELLSVGSKPEDYLSLLLQLDKGLKKTSALKERLQKSLAQNPEDENLIEELIQVYRVIGEDEKASSLIQERLQKQPQSLKWLKIAYHLAEKKQKIEQQKELAQKIILNTEVSKEDKKNYAHLLALFYLQEGKNEKALTILNELIEVNPEDQSLSKDKLSLLLKQKRWELFFPFLAEYQQKFPGDPDIQPLLFQVYLYELKDKQKLDFYLNFLRANPDLKKAQDLAYFYQEASSDLYEKALLGLEKIFPQNILWLELRYQQALQNKKEVLALEYLLKIEKQRPLNADELEAVGSSYYSMQEFEKAKEYYYKAHSEDPQNARRAYALAETYLQLKNNKDFLINLQKSKMLFEMQNHKTPEEQSLYLKTKLYLKEYQGLDEAYQKLLSEKNHPKELRYDYSEYLFETRQIKKAKEQIDQLSKDRESNRLWALQLRYDLEMKNFKKAYADLKQAREKNPKEFNFKKDLAYVAFQLKEYKVVQQILNEIDAKHEDRDLKDLHQGLKDVFLPKISSYFEFTHFGESDFYSTHLQSRQPLTASFSLLSHLQWGHFSVFNNSGNFGSFSTALEKRFFPFKILGGLELGISEERKNVSPWIEFEWEFNPHYQLALSYQNHKLKTDLPASLLEGNLEDEWKIRQQGKFNEKLLWSLDLAANRQVLKSSEKSGGYAINPSLQWVFLQKPYLSVAYNYLWAEQKGDDFLAKVPLIPRLNAHTLSLNYSQVFNDQLKLDANVFLGEDFSRKLHAFKGDLWGLQTQLNYSPFSVLDISARYQYAQEAAQANVGHYHQAQVGLSFYWDLYGKRK